MQRSFANCGAGAVVGCSAVTTEELQLSREQRRRLDPLGAGLGLGRCRDAVTKLSHHRAHTASIHEQEAAFRTATSNTPAVPRVRRDARGEAQRHRRDGLRLPRFCRSPRLCGEKVERVPRDRPGGGSR